MNNVPDAEAEKPWRLNKRPDFDTGAFPALADIPPAPDDLPSAEVTTAKVDSLRQANQEAGKSGATRPSAAELGGPAAVSVAPLFIPGHGTVRHRIPPARSAARPVPEAQLSPLPVMELAVEGDDWLDADAKARLAEFARRNRETPTQFLLLLLAPEFSVDPVEMVHDQLIASGLPRDRISISYQTASRPRITLTPLGR